MAPLKVLIINHTSVQELYQGKVKELAKFTDIEPTLLIPPSWPDSGFATPAEKTSDPNYRIVVGKIFYTGSGSRHFYLNKLASLVKERPDVIDIVEEPRGIVTAQTVLFKKLFSPRTKLLFHTEDNTENIYRFPFNRLEQYVFRNVDLAVSRSTKATENLRKKGFTKPVELLTHGVDIDVFAPRPVPRLREKYALNEHPVIGYVGGLREKKGLFTLLEAAAKLKRPFQLLFVGDGPHRERLITRARELGISGDVHITGRISHREIPAYYSLMDVFILPSQTGSPERPDWREMFGRVLAEAMAARRPLVGSSSGAIPQVIADAGLVFPERNAEALAEVLDKLLADENLRNDLADKAYKRVSENYSWQVIAKKLRDIYLNLKEA